MECRILYTVITSVIILFFFPVCFFGKAPTIVGCQNELSDYFFLVKTLLILQIICRI